MKKILLIFCFSLMAMTYVSAQSVKGTNCENCADTKTKQKKYELSIYPNPASEFIGVTDDEAITEINIYNLVGKRIKNFQASKGQRYNISDIPTGVYLTQLIGEDGKVITTQRLSKR